MHDNPHYNRNQNRENMMPMIFLTGSLLILVSVLYIVMLGAGKRTDGNLSDSDPESGYVSAVEAAAEPEPKVKPEVLSLAGDPLADKLDALFTEKKAANVSIAVIEDGYVTRHYEYGYKDINTQEPMTPKTKMRVASLSKIVATMTAMTLYDSGDLDLNLNIEDYLGFPVRGSRADIPITTRMLMSHTSSLIDSEASMNASSAPLSSIVKGLKSNELSPGGFWYANMNFGIMGAEVEHITGKYFQDYTRDVIVAPMGLDCGYDSACMNEPSDFAELYYYKKNRGYSIEAHKKAKARRAVGEGWLLPFGAFMSSSTELAEIVTVLINDGEYEGLRILSPDAVALMETPVVSVTEEGIPGVTFGQCLGLRRNNVFGREIYYHNGNAYGVASLLAYDKQNRCGVIIITSGTELTRTSESMGIYTACYAVADIIFSNLSS